MPLLNYHCRKDRGGCGHKFTARKAEPNKQDIVCPACDTWGKEKHKASGEFKVEVLVSRHRWKVAYLTEKRDGRCSVCGEKFQTYYAENEYGYDGECDKCANLSEKDWSKVQFVSDLAHQDGNTGDDIDMPSLGRRIRSRRDLDDARKRVRDEIWQKTFGRHETWVTDPDTGKLEKDYVDGKGVDVGTIRTSEPEERPKAPDLGNMAVKEAMAKIKKEAAK